ncbi:MAG TPA: hypothetical protein VK468_11685, partial [Pyrinomonadaceae bacterium]|nr:hypothetical protein [Pyrinomonadaceae bacterium]
VFVSVAVFAVAGASVDSAGAGCSAGVSAVELFNTETLPLKAGIEISNADIIKNEAATIVSLDSTEAVPRGP